MFFRATAKNAPHEKGGGPQRQKFGKPHFAFSGWYGVQSKPDILRKKCASVPPRPLLITLLAISLNAAVILLAVRSLRQSVVAMRAQLAQAVWPAWLTPGERRRCRDRKCDSLSSVFSEPSASSRLSRPRTLSKFDCGSTQLTATSAAAVIQVVEIAGNNSLAPPDRSSTASLSSPRRGCESFWPRAGRLRAWARPLQSVWGRLVDAYCCVL